MQCSTPLGLCISSTSAASCKKLHQRCQYRTCIATCNTKNPKNCATRPQHTLQSGQATPTVAQTISCCAILCLAIVVLHILRSSAYLMDVLDQFEGSPDLAPILEQVNQMDTDLLVRRLRMRQHVLQEMKRQDSCCNITSWQSCLLAFL